MEGFESKIKRDVIDEALGNLHDAESSFMKLEGSKDPKPLLAHIFRFAHNLKGSSRAVGFLQVAEFTHQLENLVLKLQRDELGLVSPVITTLLRCNDRLVEMLTKLRSDFDAKVDNSDLLHEIQSWLEGKFTVMSVPSSTLTMPRFGNSNEGDDIRVSLDRINELNTAIQDLVSLQTEARQQSASGALKGLQVTMRKLSDLTKHIQALTQSMRMVSIKPLIQKLQRVVRDASAMLGKEVEMEIHGESIEMDKSVLDRLSDPLIHILRNSVDHGLEIGESRESAGKPRAGLIKIFFKHEGTDLVVEVRDDGRGINTKLLRRRAVEMKLISRNQVLTEAELIDFIFFPGFTTKSEINEISGRGVGMDVVKNHVEKLGGSVTVSTIIGRGSSIRLQIPLSSTEQVGNASKKVVA